MGGTKWPGRAAPAAEAEPDPMSVPLRVRCAAAREWIHAQPEMSAEEREELLAIALWPVEAASGDPDG